MFKIESGCSKKMDQKAMKPNLICILIIAQRKSVLKINKEGQIE